MKTFVAKPGDITHNWCLFDATDQTLGRLASEIARRLRGKHKPIYTPFMDTGDYIVVINADRVHLTGNKVRDKVYYWHTRYPGGLKSRTVAQELSGQFPERVLERAVRGMLPKNALGRQMFRKLKIYRGSEHPHTAQQPTLLTLES